MTGREQLAAMALGLLIVEIDGSQIRTGETYVDKTTGTRKPLSDTQAGFVWQGARYPLQVSIDIPDGKKPYPNGLYVTSGPMFDAGKYGRWEFKGTRAMELVPIAEAARALVGLVAQETGEVIELQPGKSKAA